MSQYKQRLETAKKEYIATDGDGEAGVRLCWSIRQLGHSWTNMDVENLRIVFPKLQGKSFYKDKDWAYVVGHITQFFVVPTIVLQFLAVRKVK